MQAVPLSGGVSQFLNYFRIDPIEHPGRDCLARLPDDLGDGDGYKMAHDRVGPRIAQSYTEGSK